jgi:hypothetical protein
MDALKDGDRDRAEELAEALRNWIKAGGYLPLWTAAAPYCAVMADGGLMCIPCASGENGSDAGTAQWSPGRRAKLDPNCPDDTQWVIIGIQGCRGLGPCDHCGVKFPA